MVSRGSWLKGFQCNAKVPAMRSNWCIWLWAIIPLGDHKWNTPACGQIHVHVYILPLAVNNYLQNGPWQSTINYSQSNGPWHKCSHPSDKPLVGFTPGDYHQFPLPSKFSCLCCLVYPLITPITYTYTCTYMYTHAHTHTHTHTHTYMQVGGTVINCVCAVVVSIYYG